MMVVVLPDHQELVGECRERLHKSNRLDYTPLPQHYVKDRSETKIGYVKARKVGQLKR